MEHPEGIEPSCPAWKAGVLPLNHGCGLDGHNANGRSSSLRFAVPHVLRMMPPPRGDSEHAGHGNWWGSGELNPDCALIRRETGYKSVVLTIERLPLRYAPKAVEPPAVPRESRFSQVSALKMAEGVGFGPTEDLSPRRFSGPLQ